MNEKEAVQEVFADLAPRYEEVLDDELRTFWSWSYQDYVDFLVERSEIQQGDIVLDIATGTAMIPSKINDQDIPGVRIAGLDISESMLLQGKKNLGNSNHNKRVSLTCGDGMALPFPAKSFDIIITGLASHHMDIKQMLIEIKRTLKHNGKLSMVDVGVSPLWNYPVIRQFIQTVTFLVFLFRENLTRARAEAAAVTNVFTPDEWENSLLNLGFTDITIEEAPGKSKIIPIPFILKATLSDTLEDK